MDSVLLRQTDLNLFQTGCVVTILFKVGGLWYPNKHTVDCVWVESCTHMCTTHPHTHTHTHTYTYTHTHYTHTHTHTHSHTHAYTHTHTHTHTHTTHTHIHTHTHTHTCYTHRDNTHKWIDQHHCIYGCVL